MGIEMDDKTRERLIERYKNLMLQARGIEWQRYYQNKMFALIKGRSPAQVERMEAEQKLKLQMSPWALK